MFSHLDQFKQYVHCRITNLLDDGKQKNAVPELDGIRAIACLTVIFFHLNYFARSTTIWHPIQDLGSFVGAIMLGGQAGVILFFVLSGFLLFMPYARALLFDADWPSMRLFYLRRAFRIIPAYYLSLVLMILFIHPEYIHSQYWKDDALFLIFFMDAPATYQKINGPFWTLAVEAQFYMLLPLLALGIAWLVRRGAMRRRLYLLGLCLGALVAWGLLSRLFGSYYLAHPSETLPGLPRSILNKLLIVIYGNTGKFLEVFAIGMLLSVCYVCTKNRGYASNLVRVLRRLSPILFIVGLLLLLFIALWRFNLWYYGYTLHFFDPLAHDFDEWNYLILAVAYALCMAAILYGEKWLQRPFAWSPLRWIGLISYSLYMWHVPLIAAFATYVILPHMQGWPRPIEYVVYWLWVALCIFPFSALFYIMIEKPWIQIGERVRLRMLVRKSEGVSQNTS